MLSSRPIQIDAAAPRARGRTPGNGLKTPGRGLKNRSENAMYPGAMTVNGKGKGAAGLRTPFQAELSRPRKDALYKTEQKPSTTTQSRPFLDKTPFPNRAQPFETITPYDGKLPKVLFEHILPTKQGGTPGSGKLPSSTRKHLRPPSKSFETPLNQGNHWDVSDTSIVLPSSNLQATIEESLGEDLDEVEYGPPNTLDLPYQPPFDFELPNYKEVGKTIREFAFSIPIDDEVVLPEIDIKADDIPTITWDLLATSPDLDEDPDDPFRQAVMAEVPVPISKIVPKVANIASRVQGSSIFNSRVAPSSRIHSAASTTLNVAKPKLGVSRPGTSLSAGTTSVNASRSAVIRKPSTLKTATAARVTPAFGSSSALPSARVASSKATELSKTSSLSATTPARTTSLSTTRSRVPLTTTASTLKRNNMHAASIQRPGITGATRPGVGRKPPVNAKVADADAEDNEVLLVKGLESQLDLDDFLFDV